MKLTTDQRFTLSAISGNVSINIYDSDRTSSRQLISNSTITGDITVIEISEKYFPMSKVQYNDNGETKEGWTIVDFTNLDPDIKIGVMCNLKAKTDDDRKLGESAGSEAMALYAKASAEEQAKHDENTESVEITYAHQYETANVRDADGDIIVTPNITNSNTGQLASTVNTELEAIVRSYGVPPQWTKHVDPRTVACTFTGGYPITARLGRRFIEVTLSNPTVIDIAPGYVYFNSKTLSDDASLFDSSGNGDGSDVLWNAIKNNHGSLFTIKPCFGSFSYGKTSKKTMHGYMAYVNALMRIVSVYMSRRALNTSNGLHKYFHRDDPENSVEELPELKDRPMPIFGDVYRKFDWEKYDESNWLVVGSAYIGYVSANEDKFQYIRFFSIEGTSSTDDFSTDVGETTIESTINGMLSGTLKDAAFLMGGIIGGEMGNDFGNVENAIEQAINGTSGLGSGAISSLLHSVSAFATGGKLVFPQVISDCAYGKAMTVKCTFPAIYGDAEANYLNSIAPYIHVLAFCLPHQVHTSMDMYTYPFLVKAFSKGIFSCEMGVLTNLSVSRGGEDGELWSYDSNSTEISISFEIRPLISKLIMSSTLDGPGWVLKNQGLQEYLGGLCGVDLRNNKIEMAKELFATLFQGQSSAFFHNILNSVLANTFVGDIANIFNMMDNYISYNKNTTTDSSTYDDNGDNYEALSNDSWNSNTL